MFLMLSWRSVVAVLLNASGSEDSRRGPYHTSSKQAAQYNDKQPDNGSVVTSRDTAGPGSCVWKHVHQETSYTEANSVARLSCRSGSHSH